MRPQLHKTSFWAFLLTAFLWTGCQSNEKLHEEISPQWSRTSCSHLNTADIDLTEGFTGTYDSLPDSHGVFKINSYEPNYPIKPAFETTYCEGVCAIRLTFAPANTLHPLQIDALEVTSVVLHTTGSSGSQSFDVQNFEWDYPELTIALVMSNEINNFDISFASNQADDLSVVDVQVLDGLCVIDNVDLVDKLVRIHLGDGINH